MRRVLPRSRWRRLSRHCRQGPARRQTRTDRRGRTAARPREGDRSGRDPGRSRAVRSRRCASSPDKADAIAWTDQRRRLPRAVKDADIGAPDQPPAARRVEGIYRRLPVRCVGERAGAGRHRGIDSVAELDEERAVAEGADARVAQDRNGVTFTLALANASRTARAISGAPGVSPCTHRVSTAIFRKVPSTAVTPPSLTKDRACRTAAAGSVSTDPAIERD